jgi:hypothetical protein
MSMKQWSYLDLVFFIAYAQQSPRNQYFVSTARDVEVAINVEEGLQISLLLSILYPYSLKSRISHIKISNSNLNASGHFQSILKGLWSRHRPDWTLAGKLLQIARFNGSDGRRYNSE